MTKQLKILYKIFELELKPPFQVVNDNEYDILINSHSDTIATYYSEHNDLALDEVKCGYILSKVRQIYYIDELSDEEICIVGKHLINWFQDKFPQKIDLIHIWNSETDDLVDCAV